MSIKKEITKSCLLAIIPLSIGIYGSLNFLETDESKIFWIAIIVLLTITYLVLLRNNLQQLKNDYDHDMNERKKEREKEIEETQNELARNGRTFSGHAMKKLGKLSAYKELEEGQSITTNPLEVAHGSMPKGEINENYEDFKKHRTKKFKLNFTRAKYLVLVNLFKIKN